MTPLARPMQLAAGLALAASLAAGPAFADDLLRQTQACATAADHSICLLKVAMQEDGGSAIWRESDLRRAPAILSALGLTANGVAAARGTDPTERMFFGPMDEAAAAVDEVLALDRTGRPAEEALRPVLELSTTAPDLPPFFASQGEQSSARVLAFSFLLQRIDPALPRPSPALALAAAQAWERELTAPGVSRSRRRGAVALAAAYRDLGDQAGVDRAIAIVPFVYDRLDLLIGLGRLDEAAAGLTRLKASEVEADVRIELSDMLARLTQRNVQDLPAFFEEQAREARREGDEATAREMDANARASRRSLRSSGLPPLPREDVEARMAEVRLSLRDRMLDEALRSGKPEAARPMADLLLIKSDAPDDPRRFNRLLRVATPSKAAERLEGLEARMTAQRGAERLAVVSDGWRTLGHPERAEQLEARANGWAAAGGEAGKRYAAALGEVYLSQGRTEAARALGAFPPEDLLRSDLKAGRGFADFDAYLAEADEMARGGALSSCTLIVENARQFAELPKCIAARERFEPRAGYATAASAMQSASLVASLGDAATARTLFDHGLRIIAASVAADPTKAELPAVFSTATLIAVAKAELRAQGRLPPRAPSQTVLGAAP